MGLTVQVQKRSRPSTGGKTKKQKNNYQKIRIVIYYLGMEMHRTFDPIAVTTAELKNKAFSMLEEVFET